MGFDDEVDALKSTLAEERGGATARASRVARLKDLLKALEGQITSRRIVFRLETDDEEDEPGIYILYAPTGDELGVILADDAGFSFESEEDDYFPDLEPAADVNDFAGLVYDLLKTGLAAYELDVAGDGKED